MSGESFAEVTQAGISHHHCHLRDIMLPRAQKIRGCLQSKITQVTGDGHPRLFGEDAAEITGAAAALAAKCREGRRALEITGQCALHGLDALPGQPLLPVAAELLLRGERRMREKLEDLSLVPKSLSRPNHRWIYDLLGQQSHFRGKGNLPHFATCLSGEEALNRPRRARNVLADRRTQPVAREFHAQKQVSLPWTTQAAATPAIRGIMRNRPREERPPLSLPRIHRASSRKIDADLHRLRLI